MIYIRLQGGFGNQLFIWSAAHYLSELKSRPVRLVCKPKSVHVFISGLAEISERDIKVVSGLVPRFLFRVIEYLKLNAKSLFNLINKKGWYYSEKMDEAIFVGALSRAFLLEGFFQRGWIVENIWPQLSSEIARVTQRYYLIQPEMNMRAFAIHVRRGDYQISPKTWGLLSLEFYEAALGSLEGATCFTDMPKDQACEFFKRVNNINIITPSEANEIEVLLGLSRMSKVVIANSSLSWWGGYLAAKRGAEVIAPEPWFLDSSSWSSEIYPPIFTRTRSIYQLEES